MIPICILEYLKCSIKISTDLGMSEKWRMQQVCFMNKMAALGYVYTLEKQT